MVAFAILKKEAKMKKELVIMAASLLVGGCSSWHDDDTAVSVRSDSTTYAAIRDTDPRNTDPWHYSADPRYRNDPRYDPWYGAW